LKEKTIILSPFQLKDCEAKHVVAITIFNFGENLGQDVYKDGIHRNKNSRK
jgi:hypothetical protein